MSGQRRADSHPAPEASMMTQITASAAAEDAHAVVAARSEHLAERLLVGLRLGQDQLTVPADAKESATTGASTTSTSESTSSEAEREPRSSPMTRRSTSEPRPRSVGTCSAGTASETIDRPSADSPPSAAAGRSSPAASGRVSVSAAGSGSRRRGSAAGRWGRRSGGRSRGGRRPEGVARGEVGGGRPDGRMSSAV